MKNIKRLFTILTVALLTMSAIALNTKAHNNKVYNLDRLYAKSGIVLKVDTEKNTVTFSDSNSNLWVFTETEDWEVSDTVVCIMDNMGTENIYDDEIIKVKYEHWNK